MVTLGESEAVFENPDHDFPQRITYRRSGRELHVRIEDLSATKSSGWRLVRSELP
jgi:hypothetical protein